MIHVRPKNVDSINLYQRVVVDQSVPHDLLLHYAIACMHDYMDSIIANIDPYGSLKNDKLCAAIAYKDTEGLYRIRIAEADEANGIVEVLRNDGVDVIKVKFIGVYPDINFSSIPSYIEFRDIPMLPVDKFYTSLDEFFQSNETMVCGIKNDRDDIIDFKMPE